MVERNSRRVRGQVQDRIKGEEAMQEGHEPKLNGERSEKDWESEIKGGGFAHLKQWGQ